MKKSDKQPNAKVIALVLLLAFLWGGNSVSIKIGLQGIPPLALAGLRFSLGLGAISLWLLIHRVQIRMNRGELLPLTALSAIFISQIVTLNVGTRFTTASRSAILINTYTFFTALFAHFFVPGDRLSLKKTAGIMVALIGIFLTFADNLQVGVSDYLIGDLIVLVSGCLLGLRTVVTKRLVQAIHPYRLLVWLMIFSLPCFFGLSFLFERGEVYRFSTSGIAAILYQGIVIAGFCFVAWVSVLEKHSPSKLVVLFFTTPLFGVVLGYLLLGDEVNINLIAGAILVACGIYIVHRPESLYT